MASFSFLYSLILLTLYDLYHSTKYERIAAEIQSRLQKQLTNDQFHYTYNEYEFHFQDITQFFCFNLIKEDYNNFIMPDTIVLYRFDLTTYSKNIKSRNPIKSRNLLVEQLYDINFIAKTGDTSMRSIIRPNMGTFNFGQHPLMDIPNIQDAFSENNLQLIAKFSNILNNNIEKLLKVYPLSHSETSFKILLSLIINDQNYYNTSISLILDEDIEISYLRFNSITYESFVPDNTIINYGEAFNVTFKIDYYLRRHEAEGMRSSLTVFISQIIMRKSYIIYKPASSFPEISDFIYELFKQQAEIYFDNLPTNDIASDEP